MTTDLCTEEVTIEMSPQVEIMGTESETTMVRGGVASGIAGAPSGSLELGRRLLVAARFGNTALVLDLMAKGAPFTTDWLGTSPLHLAAGNDHAATCGVLLRAGVSRDSRTKVERTPLHVAAHAGHVEPARVLLRHGALVECRDLLRMTPLHWAAERGHADVVALLLQHGADPAPVSKFDKTPLQLAARRRHAHVVALLEDAVRQREAASSVRALVEERLAEEPPADALPRHRETFIRKIPDVRTPPPADPPKRCHIKATKVKRVEEKPEKTGEKIQEAANESANGKINENGGGEGAAAILRRHGITLLPPDHGGTVLSALQSGRTVVLSDAGKLMLQESGAPAARAATHPGKVRIVQLPTEPRGAGAGAGVGAAAGGRPPVKIIMNKSNFRRLVAGGAAGVGVAAGAGAGAGAEQEAAQLRAQLAASQRTVARLTASLRACRARIAALEGQRPRPRPA